jgi:DNA-binding transcriptional LysR family regulator
MLLTLPERHAQLLNISSTDAGPMYRVYPFPLPAPRLEAHLYWHESVENDPANRWLREEIESVLLSESRGLARSVAGRVRKKGQRREARLQR